MKFELSKSSKGRSPLKYNSDETEATHFEIALNKNIKVYASRFGIELDRIYAGERKAGIIGWFNQLPTGAQRIVAKKARQESKYSRFVRYRDQIAFQQVYAGKLRYGTRVYFCVSCYRNVAGFYLVWKKVVDHRGAGVRVHLDPRIHARKTKPKAEELAVHLAKQWDQRNNNQRSERSHE